jgi:thioredoxin 1
VPHIVHLTADTFDQEVVQHAGITIVDFWATWCGPCKMLAPLLDEIAAERVGNVKVAKVNVDEEQRVVMRFNVRSAPTLLIFKNGEPVAQIIGAVPKKKIEAVLDQLAA